LGDAISHAVLPGVVLGYLLSGKLAGWPILAGALAAGMLAAMLIYALQTYGRVPEDASIGATYTAFFAAGILMLSGAASHVDLDPGCVLYGQIELSTVTVVTLPGVGWEIPRALYSLAPALLATVLFVVLLWKELQIAMFDPDLATSMGYRASVIHLALVGMVAVVTVAALEAVGAILVVAMLIVPAATAHLLTDRLDRMLILAVLVGTAAAAGGAIGAMAVNTSGAGMMAVCAGAFFLLAVFFAPRHGLLSRKWQNFQLAVRIAGEDVIAALYRREEQAPTSGQPIGVSRDESLAIAGWGLAARFAVSRLTRQMHLQRDPMNRLVLTSTGRALGEQLIRGHRLWESYLAENFDLPLDHIHESAERFEHYLGPELQAELAQALNQPNVDPHGKPIPPEGSSGSRSNET
jgi:manganese/zinc/iron transport system permease protein